MDSKYQRDVKDGIQYLQNFPKGEPRDFWNYTPHLKKAIKNKGLSDVEVCEIVTQIAELDVRKAFLCLEASCVDAGYRQIFAKEYLGNNENLRLFRENITVYRKDEELQINISYMEALYLALLHIQSEEGEFFHQVLEGVFGQGGDPEITFPRYYSKEHFWGTIVARAVKNLIGYKNIKWQTGYCKILLGIYTHLENSFQQNNKLYFFQSIESLMNAEKGMKDKEDNGIIPDDAYAQDYYKILIENQKYNSAHCFLYHVRLNPENPWIFMGKDSREFIKDVYATADHQMIFWGRQLEKELRKKEKPEADQSEIYPREEWKGDVLKCIEDSPKRREIEKWFDLDLFYDTLAKIIEKDEKNKWYGVYAKLEQIDQYKLFDIEQMSLLKDILTNLAFIFNQLLLEQGAEETLKVIERLGDRNIYAYKYIGILGDKNKFKSISNIYQSKKSEIRKKLEECTDVRTVVAIYMNSHLRTENCIDLAEIVEWTFKGRDTQETKNIWAEYQLYGVVSHIDDQGNSKHKIVIDPQYVYTKSVYDNYKEKGVKRGWNTVDAQSVNNQLFYSDQKWFSRNKSKTELFVKNAKCTFLIAGFEENDGIWVKDITMEDERQLNIQLGKMEEFPTRFLGWLEAVPDRVKEMGRYEKWKDMCNRNGEDRKVYSAQNWKNQDEKDKLALCILDVIKELVLMQRMDALYDFLEDITTEPLERINEYRYYPQIVKMDKSYEMSESNRFDKEVKDRAEWFLRDCSEEQLPGSVKLQIYLNTCMRKFYPFNLAYQYIGESFFREDDEPIYMMLRFMGNEKGHSVFREYYKKDKSVFNLYKIIFWYPKEVKLDRKKPHRVSLEKYDSDNQCFILREVNIPTKDVAPQSQFYQTLFDLKNGRKTFDEIHNKLRGLPVRFETNRQIDKFAHELNETFKMKDWKIKESEKVLLCIGAKNPFYKKDLGFKFPQEVLEKYLESYDRFLEDWRKIKGDEGSLRRFMYIYQCSFLKLIVSLEDFRKKTACDDDAWVNAETQVRYMCSKSD